MKNISKEIINLILKNPSKKFLDIKLENINQSLEKYEKIKKVYTITDKEISKFLTLKMSIKSRELIDYVKNSYK